MPWWPSWRSRGFGRRRRTRTWRASCSPKASTSTGPKRSDITAHQVLGEELSRDGRSLLRVVIFDQNSLLNTCSSECVKIPPAHTNTTAAFDVEAVCNVYISSAQRQSELITLQLHLLSLCGWRGEYILSFIVPALKWILSGGGLCVNV